MPLTRKKLEVEFEAHKREAEARVRAKEAEMMAKIAELEAKVAALRKAHEDAKAAYTWGCMYPVGR